MTAPDDKRLVPRQECLKSPYEETNAFKSGDIINSKEDLRRMARESRDRAIASITGKAPDVNADVRARFEAWAKSQRYYVDRAAHGFYKSCRTHDAWEGYRAAHADLSGEVRELVDAARVVERRLIPLLSGKLRDIDHADFIAFFTALAKFTHQETK